MAASTKITKNNTTGLDETEVNALEELQHSFAAIKIDQSWPRPPDWLAGCH
jgi:hypothetical protein